MFSFAADYYIGVFISTFGALQFAFSLGGLKGVLIFKSSLVARSIGLALAAFGLALFMGTESRNINDYEGGLDANEQALLFFLGAVSALAVALCLSSLVNRGMKGSGVRPEGGLDALRDTNYALALARSVAYWGGKWRTRTKRYLFG